MKHRVAWRLSLLAAGVSIRADAEAASFAVQQHRLGPSHVLIRVYDQQTGRTIWTRSTADPSLIGWSADRSALAVMDDWGGASGGNQWGFRLLVWRNS